MHWLTPIPSLTSLTLSICLTLSINTHALDPAASATFYDFTYQGKDTIFEKPLAKDEYQNPILAGFYPDPSITRAGDDYYLVTSSFAYSPGVPIFHSKDLVHWKALGHVLVTPKQLPLYNQQISRGVYAPTIRFHAGVFYLITTLVDVRGNFIVTASNPAGPWSAPIELPEVGGIDPDIFFDDDGRVYITHNNAPLGEPLYQGHRAIWQWEFDLKTKKIIKDSGHIIVNGGTDIKQKPVWIEAPHIYKINGWYYLLCAEGGTAYEHSEVVFRTRRLTEPFMPYSGNPILTQRDADVNRPNPITTAGHADIVQTQEGEWWAVFLATRAYDKTAYNTGRETFLLPLHWENEWPVILNKNLLIPYRAKNPNIQQQSIQQKNLQVEPQTGNFLWRDQFTTPTLLPHWNTLGTVESPWYQLKDKSTLNITATNNRLSGLAQPAYIGRRQQHTHFNAFTRLKLPAATMSAGIAIFQSEADHYYVGVKQDQAGYQLFVEQTKKSNINIVAAAHVDKEILSETITLGMEGNAGTLDFYYINSVGKLIYLIKNADGKMLSTELAGGFVGTTIGMHARTEH
jgi:xylan 1,4-beta-xylosidase